MKAPPVTPNQDFGAVESCPNCQGTGVDLGDLTGLACVVSACHCVKGGTPEERELWAVEQVLGWRAERKEPESPWRDLTLHESRFAAAKWLESQGRPGWRFLDGPGPLTAEQSARVLYEACLRARDGATAIVGVLGEWQAANGVQRRYAILPVRFAAYLTAFNTSWFLLWRREDKSIGDRSIGGDDIEGGATVVMTAADAGALANGWFCL